MPEGFGELSNFGVKSCDSPGIPGVPHPGKADDRCISPFVNRLNQISHSFPYEFHTTLQNGNCLSNNLPRCNFATIKLS